MLLRIHSVFFTFCSQEWKRFFFSDYDYYRYYLVQAMVYTNVGTIIIIPIITPIIIIIIIIVIIIIISLI